MATTLIDTAGWQVVVPVKPALNLAGSRLTATLADRFGGAVVALDSAIRVPGYDGAHQIDWAADANGLTDRLLLTVTRAMRGTWLATAQNGLPGLVTLFADVQRTVTESSRDPVALGRTSFSVVPGTDSPAIAAAVGGFQAVLTPIQGLQTVTATALHEATTTSTGAWSVDLTAVGFAAPPRIISSALSADTTMANSAQAVTTARSATAASGFVNLPNTIAVGGMPIKRAGAGLTVIVLAIGP